MFEILENNPFDSLFQVSWMRRRDLHILTSSIHAYTGDDRFSVKHPEPSNEWTLKIEFVQQRDAGVYECQVNTDPKMNLAFELKVEGKAANVRPLQSRLTLSRANARVDVRGPKDHLRLRVLSLSASSEFCPRISSSRKGQPSI